MRGKKGRIEFDKLQNRADTAKKKGSRKTVLIENKMTGPKEIKEFLVFEGVSKRFRDLIALDNVSFEVGQGEIFGYIGPNGAGKTTTIKIMVGLLSEFEGILRIGGYSMPRKRDQVHKTLGYLPQNVAFQEWRTVDHALRTFGSLPCLDTGADYRLP